MSAPGDYMIRLDGVKKVFFTDEVETHALSVTDLSSFNANTKSDLCAEWPG